VAAKLEMGLQLELRRRCLSAASFKDVRLPGGFVIAGVEFTKDSMLDALEQEAVAQTRIVGREFRLLMRAGLSLQGLTLGLCHETLEAATVASLHPPAGVMEFNESDCERAAHIAHDTWGEATPANLNRRRDSGLNQPLPDFSAGGRVVGFHAPVFCEPDGKTTKVEFGASFRVMAAATSRHSVGDARSTAWGTSTTSSASGLSNGVTTTASEPPRCTTSRTISRLSTAEVAVCGPLPIPCCTGEGSCSCL
jgi:hypothetical protein